MSRPLPRSTATAEGLDPRAVLDFVEALEAANLETHSLMILRHGKVVAEGWWHPYQETIPHVLYSLTKSFMSTAVGLAVAEGRFSVSDPVISFFPQDLPDDISPNLRAMTVRDLLTMSSGHADDPGPALTAKEGNWIREILSWPVPHVPGTYFLYNSSASYLAGAIVVKTTGENLGDFLRSRLFDPLGIGVATWLECPMGINVGGWGLSLTTEDIAKFGELYLRGGEWNGVPLLAPGWVAEATAALVANGDDPDNDWNQGYGYQFWRCRHGGYRGDGAFGQFCIVLPEQDAVVAMTSATEDMGTVLERVWDTLLPGFDRTVDRLSQRELESKLLELVLPPSAVPGLTREGLVAYGSPDLCLVIDPHKVEVTLGGMQGEGRFDAGFGGWLGGAADLIGQGEVSVGASAVWVSPTTLDFKVVDLGGPLCCRYRVELSDDQARVTRESLGSFGLSDPPPITLARLV